MSDDELYALIGTSRNNRHAPSKPVKEAKPKAAKQSKGSQDMLSAFNALTPEQAQALLEKLTKNGNPG